MVRATFCLVALPCWILMLVVSEDLRGQEPRQFNVKKPQQLTSMNPSQDATVGGTPMRVAQPPVVTNLRPSHFVVPGWDSKGHKYLVLDRSSSNHVGQKLHRQTAPVLQQRQVNPYAYGWFGAKPHSHPHRSFGYQQAYTQWAFE